MPNNTLPEILAVPWIMVIETQPLAPIQPAPVLVRPDPILPPAPEPPASVRPWAKPLLAGALALAALWLVGLAIIILDGALFADPVVRGSLGVAGVPICILIVVAFIADPDRESPDEEYWTWGSYPVGQCTPSRSNTPTGRQP